MLDLSLTHPTACLVSMTLKKPVVVLSLSYLPLQGF